MKPDVLSLKWLPIPKNPWKLLDESGACFKSFPSAGAACAWLRKNGYGL